MKYVLLMFGIMISFVIVQAKVMNDLADSARSELAPLFEELGLENPQINVFPIGCGQWQGRQINIRDVRYPEGKSTSDFTERTILNICLDEGRPVVLRTVSVTREVIRIIH